MKFKIFLILSLICLSNKLFCMNNNGMGFGFGFGFNAEQNEKEDLDFLEKLKSGQIIDTVSSTNLIYRTTHNIPVLKVAVKMGYYKSVKYLLEKGTDPNIEYEENTPLIDAIEKSNYPIYLKIFEELLIHGANPNGISKRPLYEILSNSDLRNSSHLINLLIQHKVNLNLSHSKFGTPLDAAIIFGKVQEMLLFLSNGAQLKEDHLIKILLVPNKVLEALVEVNDQYLDNLLKLVNQILEAHNIDNIIEIYKNIKKLVGIPADQVRPHLFEKKKYLEFLKKQKNGYRPNLQQQTKEFFVDNLVNKCGFHAQLPTIISGYCDGFSESEMMLFLLDLYQNAQYLIMKDRLKLMIRKQSENQVIEWPFHDNRHVNKIFMAIINEKIDSLKHLFGIEKNFNNLTDNFFNWTPLMWAAFIGNYEMTALILSKCNSDDLMKKDICGYYAFEIAKNFGNYEISEFIQKQMLRSIC